MTTKITCPWVLSLTAALVFGIPKTTFAQNITAAPDGTGTSITIDGNTYQIEGGTQAGTNLFHSFQAFGLSNGEIAHFLSNPNINNIFGRVVGGEPSFINGLIQANPNLYLMNPAGIVFGTNAQLNVGGDFFATTADQICFEGGCFNSVGLNDYAALQGDPTRLGFLQGQPGGLINAGTLEVLKGKSIHLSGITVVNLGQILAPGGVATVAAVPGERRVQINQPGALLSLEVTEDVLTNGIDPLAFSELLTGSGRGNPPVVAPNPAGVGTGARPLQGNVVVGGEIVAEQIDLYAAGQVKPSDTELIQGDTRVVRFTESGENPTQGVWIDRRVDDPEVLLFGAEVGTISQIIDVIPEEPDTISPLESVAIIAEGNAGNFWLGNQWIHSENIGDYQAQLQSWGEALTENADILLYSCFTALGASGEALVAGIAELTGADVAAPVDVTGSANYGGDWTLEHSTGTIEAGNPFTAETLDFWDGKLNTWTVTNLNDSGAGSLRERIQVDATAGDMITFSVTGQIDIGSEIVWATDNLTLDGPGQDDLVLDGGGSGRIFNITANNATLKDLTIRNSSTTNNGGGIHHSGTGILTLIHSIVSGNSANGDGSGIWSAGNLALTNSTLSENSSRNRGGGIWSDGNVTLTHSTLSGNSALNTGGGIRSRGNIILNDTTIIENSAGQYGGGVMSSNGSSVTLNNSTLSGNSSRNRGGGIRSGSNVILNNSLVSGNSTIQLRLIGNNGGGIWSHGDVILNNSTLSENSAGTRGGGVWSRGDVILNNSTLSGNSAYTNGGGILNYGNVASNNSTFSENLANTGGGGVLTYGNVILNSSIFSGNSAGKNGGAIRTNNNSNVTLNSSIVSGNSASEKGGAIRSNGNVVLNSSIVSGNSAGTNGGGVLSNGHTTLNNSIASGNSASSRGGGIYSYTNVALTDSVVSGNSAGYGGGIHLISGQATLTNSTLIDNQAASSDQGNGIYAENSSVLIEHNGDLHLTDSIVANDGSTETISLIGKNVLLEVPIQSNGADIEINAQETVQALTFDATLSSAGTTGGNITINAGSDVQLRNMLAFGTNGDGGNISITSTEGLATTTVDGSEGVLNSSGNNGNAGNIAVNATGALTLGKIFAEGVGGTGGTVNLTSESLVRITGTGIQGFGNASISTAGNASGGNIVIRHGGLGLIPFTVGDASTNGTVGRLSTGTGSGQTLAPTQGFLYNFSQGGIQILSVQDGDNPNPPAQATLLPLPGSNPPLWETTHPASSAKHFLKFIAEQVGGELTIDENTNTVTVTPQGEETPLVFTWAQKDGAKDLLIHSSDGVDIAELDERLEDEYDQEEVDEPVTLANIRETFATIEQQTGTRPVLIYALSTQDALELILVTPQDNEPLIHKVVPDADRETLRQAIDAFHRRITKPNLNLNYLAPAQQLYDWLIRPIEGAIENLNIDTLVFAMGDGLRAIPMAALHDGNQFLIEKYSLGQIPSLSLTNSDYQPLHQASTLAMGASEFQTLDPTLTPLPAVPAELASIRQTFTGANAYLNNQFTFDVLQEYSRNQRPDIIHLATHAKFQAGAADNAYIQFWDQTVGFDDLRSLGWHTDPQVELLVLSACETAVGDSQAELGFAGLAVQSGVKSALASLWHVSDLGTFALMDGFYGQLRDPAVTIKAEALRQAQLALLRGEVNQSLQNGFVGETPLPPELVPSPETDLTHPFYWSGFTLVGSPW